MRRHYMGSERGIALMVSIVALVILGALVTASLSITLMERRLAGNTNNAEQAFGAAEYGLNEALDDWQTGTWNTLATWDSTTFSGVPAFGSGSYAGTVTRLADDMFMLDVVGTDVGGQARSRVGHFVKLQMLEISINAALTSGGATTISGSAQISGTDTDPSGWSSCSGDTADLSGMTVQDASLLTGTGTCSDLSCVAGSPAVEVDPTMSDATFFDYGGQTWADMIGMATKTVTTGTYRIEPTVSSGVCNTATIENWGDPLDNTSPCFNFFPFIYAPGDLTINGNLGQGFLMVEGDLRVQGGFEFYGVVIVKGSLITAGTGGHFVGAVMAANVNLDGNAVLGNAMVQYSSCATLKALQASSPGSPLQSRGWLRPYSE